VIVAQTPDTDALLDRLLAADVVVEHDDGSLETTPAYEETRSVYHDTYAGVSEETFRDTLVEVFDLDPETADEQIDQQGVTRDELIAFLALRSFLDDPPDQLRLAMLARLTATIGPASAVPPALREVDDEDYESFLADHPDAVVTVWKTGCAPCDAMKADLEGILDAVPDGVAVAGVDGGTVSAFRREFEVNAAPAVLSVRGGDLVDAETGRQTVDELRETFTAVYG
jgi:thiol-disulfide isomerase/thioredoxin